MQLMHIWHPKTIFVFFQSETAGFESSSDLTFVSVPSLHAVSKACKLQWTENSARIYKTMYKQSINGPELLLHEC